MYNRWKRLRVIAKSINNGASLTAACEGAKIRRGTLWKWRKENPKIDKFIENLIEGQIQVVEDALFKRAVGYRYEEVTKEREESASEKRIAKVVTKEVVPDATAIMFYLMNRAPNRWADKRALINNIVANINNSGREKLKDIPTPILKRMLEYANNGNDPSAKPGPNNGSEAY